MPVVVPDPAATSADPWLRTHIVTVETYNSEGFNGAGYAAPVQKQCGVEEASQMGRDGSGDELTIAGKLFCPLADLPLYTPESRLTIRPGRVARVTAVDVFDSKGEPVLSDVDHIEVQFV